jgi:2-oxoisovalerate dehydrogenase E2 component (dihydrolipoyl transacylase)
MGVHVIKVPDVGEGIAEVELVAWTVAVGQSVGRNQILAEVMTDKANVEIPSPVDGVIAALNGDVGSVLAVGSSLVEVTVTGDVPATEEAAPVAVSRVAPAVDDAHLSFSVVANGDSSPSLPAASGTARLGRAQEGPPRAEGERPLASPAVRARARKAGIDLRMVSGTGPAGRIGHDDLDAYWHRADGAGASLRAARGRVPNTAVTEEPIIGIRRQIARRTLAATQSIPHITYVDEVDMSAVESLRSTLNGRDPDAQVRLTVLPFLVRAMADAIVEFPIMNAHVDDETGTLATFGGVHVGIATQTPNGLVVPVVRHAEALSLWELAARIAELAAAVRANQASPADLTGSTITITSLGALGGLVTTPVINKPEVAIVGVNKIAERPVVVAGQVVVRKMMNLSSSFDHRIVDGWDAASFIQRIRQSLEEPALLFLEDG